MRVAAIGVLGGITGPISSAVPGAVNFKFQKWLVCGGKRIIRLGKPEARESFSVEVVKLRARK